MKAITASLVAALVLWGAVPAAASPPTTAAAAAAPVWSVANSTASGEQRRPAIATNRNGHVAVVWEDDRDSTDPASTTHSEIYLRVYRDGASLYEKKLSPGGDTGVTSWRHVNPDVGVDDKGNAVVVWAGDPDGNGSYQVYYRVVNTAGTVTASGTANSTAAGQQVKPRVGVDPDGAPTSGAVAFTVVWEDVQTGQPAKVKAAGYTGPTTRSWEVMASQTAGQHSNPDVAVSASGAATIVWQEDTDHNGYFNIGLVRLARSNGAAELPRHVANVNGDGQQYLPTVAANFNGDFAVAWESDHTTVRGVWTRSFTSVGNPLHTEIEVSTGAGARKPDVGIDDQSNTVVAWTLNAVDTWVRGFAPDGTTTDRLPAQPMMSVSTGTQQDMVVAVSAWGEVGVAYRDDNDGNTWGQIYLGLGILNSA